MFGFSKKYTYVTVYFLNGNKPYNYKSRDLRIRYGDIVMVKRGPATQPALVTKAEVIKSSQLPKSANRIPDVLGFADQKTKNMFKPRELKRIRNLAKKAETNNLIDEIELFEAATDDY